MSTTEPPNARPVKPGLCDHCLQTTSEPRRLRVRLNEVNLDVSSRRWVFVRCCPDCFRKLSQP